MYVVMKTKPDLNSMRYVKNYCYYTVIVQSARLNSEMSKYKESTLKKKLKLINEVTSLSKI